MNCYASANACKYFTAYVNSLQHCSRLSSFLISSRDIWCSSSKINFNKLLMRTLAQCLAGNLSSMYCSCMRLSIIHKETFATQFLFICNLCFLLTVLISATWKLKHDTYCRSWRCSPTWRPTRSAAPRSTPSTASSSSPGWSRPRRSTRAYSRPQSSPPPRGCRRRQLLRYPGEFGDLGFMLVDITRVDLTKIRVRTERVQENQIPSSDVW